MKIVVALVVAAALVVAHADEAPTRRLRAATHQRAEAKMEALKEPCDVCGEQGGDAKLESHWGGNIKPPTPAEMESQWGGNLKPPAHMEAHHHGTAARARMEAARWNQNHVHAKARAKMEGQHAH